MTRPMAKRTAKNSVFLDLFQNKGYLLKPYKTPHPEDTTATEDSITDVTIINVLTDNLNPSESWRRIQRQQQSYTDNMVITFA